MNALRSMNIVVIRIRRHVGRNEMAVGWRGKRMGDGKSYIAVET